MTTRVIKDELRRGRARSGREKFLPTAFTPVIIAASHGVHRRIGGEKI
ncbi:hypothetical protein BJY16_007428 [Actinoplanes octamycinicus]|uniref:Uncharacterized protein n=1 Tax=Actinoplanes octamycinicus TaxID=135948 RepID=A0A7W7H539_9ACTN|nr:hypothetical protein [Actinoplanes octamycinicus]MBB4743969.1 hypothetical protein [Actinoplanes octamycinicus]